MNAKEYLNQAYLLDSQIDSKLEQLKALRSLAERVTVSYEGERVTHTRNNSSLEDVILKIMESEQCISQQIARLMELKGDIGRTISLVKNTTYRVVLEKRYLCFHSWEKIAAEMGYSSRWLQTVHERAVSVVDKLLENPENKKTLPESS